MSSRARWASANRTSVTITVVDETTRKPSHVTFEIDKNTQILRGGTTLTFAEARIQKGEKISVTVDHDQDETIATVIKLDARK